MAWVRFNLSRSTNSFGCLLSDMQISEDQERQIHSLICSECTGEVQREADLAITRSIKKVRVTNCLAWTKS